MLGQKLVNLGITILPNLTACLSPTKGVQFYYFGKFNNLLLKRLEFTHYSIENSPFFLHFYLTLNLYAKTHDVGLSFQVFLKALRIVMHFFF